MRNGLKLKEMVQIALMAAIYIVIYMIVMVAVSFMGQLGHVISPGVNALFTGAVIIFINRKIGKMWEYTFFTLLIMGAFAIMGGGYLPWLITSCAAAVIADLIASRNRNTGIFALAAASGIMHIGQAFGVVVPVNLFMDSFRTHWIERGMTPELMDEQIALTKGLMGVLCTAVVFILSFAGVYIGYAILKKHLEKTVRA